MKQKTIAVKAAIAVKATPAVKAAAAAGLILAIIFAGCEMDVNEVAKAVYLTEPYITSQPASISYYPGDSTAGLELKVEYDEWTPADGALSFQWYSFDTIGAYLAAVKNDTEEALAIAGETADTLVPTLTNTSPGSRNYFYVKVTNTNPAAVDRTTSTIRSEVAVISFNATGAPAIPIITRQPANTQARFGRDVSPLSVRARVDALPANTGELFYQWYRVDLGVAGAIVETEMEGQTFSVFTPVASQLGDGYYYVKVTHTIGRVTTPEGQVTDPGVSVVETSIPATVNIMRGLRAGTPVINAQPKAALYFDGDAVVALAVDAESPDLGRLSYQWYSNTSASASGGTLLSGQTGSSYMPAVTGSEFYYVEVTNTNENVEGATTATASSRAVNVRRATAASVSANATLTLEPDVTYQYIRGYGGMEVAWANFPETFPAETELMYDPDKLGYNILRIMMPVSNTNIDLAMDDLVNVTRRRPHYYDNVKIVNKHGGYVAAAPWSPPKEWKSNNSINGGGILRHEYYKQYAAYLKSFAQHMNNRGAPIYCISIQNEPNYTAGYDGCEWTPEEMRDFFITAGRFTEGVRGWGGGRQIPRVLTMNGESANHPNINLLAIGNPAAYANIDVFGRHVYGERRQNLWDMASQVQRQDGKEVWMTEHNINSANAAGYLLDSKWNLIWRFMNDVDLVMRLNNENAFVWWASKRFYSMVGDGQYGTLEGAALPRGWGLSHYSKYTIDTTRIGFSLTGTTANTSQQINYTRAAAPDYRDSDGNTVVNGAAGDMDNITARITAYKSQDGNELSLVMWTPTNSSGANGVNMGTIRIDMPLGFQIGSVTAVQSYAIDDNSNAYHAPYDVPVSADRLSAYVTLPASRIISVKFTRK